MYRDVLMSTAKDIQRCVQALQTNVNNKSIVTIHLQGKD